MATMQIPQLNPAWPARPFQLPASRFDGSTGPRIIGQRDGKFVDLQSVGVRFMVWGAETGGTFSLVEHPIPPRTLVAPLHLHTREDEYSFILEGRWGFQLGDEIVYGEPGDLVYKPRNVWHSFWNASDGPARLLEIISRSGFEHYFVELTELFAHHGPDRPDLFVELNARYGLEMDFESVEGLVSAHGLVANAASDTAAY